MLKAKDPAGRGLPSKMALRLLRSLLCWNPGCRPTAEAALRHAYFTVDLQGQDDHVCQASGIHDGGNAGLKPHGWC